MWWLAIPVGVVCLKLLYDAVTDDERDARQRWENKRREVERSLEDHQRNIEKHIAQAQRSYDFHFLADLHYSSIKVADAAHKLLNDASISISGMSKMLQAAKEQRALLQVRLENARQEKNKEIIHDTIEQLKIVNEVRKNIFDDKDKVKEQQASFLKEVKKLNNQTRELKECIRDRCGSGGLSWFNKLEARTRKSNRRLFKTR